MKKATKILAGGGLALMFGLGTLFGVLVAPMNSTHATTSGATSASNSGDPAALAQTSDRALEIDPENDPVIFTTESGFEIKSHIVAGQTLANSKVQYFTLGSYNGTALNWIILATSTSMAEATTDAGIAINSANANGMVSMMTTSSLSANQALVISEKVIPISSYSFSISVHEDIDVSLPSNSSSGSGWAKGNSVANVDYYASSAMDNASDFYKSYSGDVDHSSLINSWFTGDRLSLASYCGNKIVKSSNFNGSYYGFALTYSQATTFLPSGIRTAKDISNTTRNYWCGDVTKLTIGTPSITKTSESNNKAWPIGYTALYNCTGSNTLKVDANYINTSGSIFSNQCQILATLSSSTSTKRFWFFNSLSSGSGGGATGAQSANYAQGMCQPHCAYAISGTTSITAYYRPAMVVDLSKF